VACTTSEPTTAPLALEASNVVSQAKEKKIPDPRLVLDSAVARNVGGPPHLYDLSVRNWSSFPDELFAPSPELPPCGLNTSASRSWVDIFDESGNFLFGFCSFRAASNLNQLYVPVNERPVRVYITITDRLTNQVYTSNLVNIPAP